MDYTRNEDKRCYWRHSGFNSVWTTEVDTGESPAAWSEPVALEEMKNYLRLNSFVDEGESPTTELSNFDLDDTLIRELITAARQRLEDYTGLSFIPKTLSAIIYNGAGNVRLEQGPVTSIISFVDADSNIIDPADYVMIGTDKIRDSWDGTRIMTYTAGYETLPKKYKIAIMMYVAASYEHRGDELISTNIYQQAFNQAGNTQSWLV